MDEHDWLAAQFETHRAHLRAVAYRMLGSASEAEDAVQESWLHVSRAGGAGIENFGGWLTRVVARVCLDMLRARNSRREEPLPPDGPDPPAEPGAGGDPEHEAVLADSLGLALLVVLDTLTPAERLAFVLHDLFAVPFDEIAPIVGRTPDAARQLASRARRRVRGAAADAPADEARRHAVVRAFLAAARGGDFAALLRVLAPDVVLRADAATVAMGAQAELRGPRAVAERFAGQAQAAQPALIDGAPGLVWRVGDQPRVVFAFTFAGEQIAAISLISDPARLAEMDLTTLDS